MLHLFNKKSFVLDAMMEMPDIHCHVLPEIDDGASDLNESTLILKKYIDLGFKKLIATPHTMGEIYPNTPATIAKALKKVEELSLNIEISAASEYMLDEIFEIHLNRDMLLPLKKNYVLIELSYFQPPINLMETIFKITSKGYVPILAHPERYAFYHKKPAVFKELKAKGCLLQINALSLSTHYGTAVQKKAFQLLEEGMYDYIGTDTHRLEHLEKLAEIKLSKTRHSKVAGLARNNQFTFS